MFYFFGDHEADTTKFLKLATTQPLPVVTAHKLKTSPRKTRKRGESSIRTAYSNKTTMTLIGEQTEEYKNGYNDGRAHVIGEAKRFILHSLKNRGSTNRWNVLSEDFRQDRDIVLAAFAHGHVKQEDLPHQWRHDRSFILEAVGEEPTCWYNLSKEYQQNPEFVRNFSEFSDKPLITTVFEKIPALRHDREIWDTIISLDLFDDDLRDLAPTDVLNDRELMLKVCRTCFTALLEVGDALQVDRDFLHQAIDLQPMSLMYVTKDVQRRFPELLTDNLKKYFEQEHSGNFLLDKIAEEFWTAPWFVKAWFTSGGPLKKETLTSR